MEQKTETIGFVEKEDPPRQPDNTPNDKWTPPANTRLKPRVRNNKMLTSLSAADPDYHKVIFALAGDVYKVGREAEYEEYMTSPTFTLPYAVYLYGYCFAIDSTSGFLRQIELEAGNSQQRGLTNWGDVRGIAARPNQATHGDSLYFFLNDDSSNKGVYRVNPRDGSFTLVDGTTNYAGIKHMTHNGSALAYYIDGTAGIKIYDMDNDSTSSLTTDNWSNTNCMCYLGGKLYGFRFNGMWRVDVSTYSPTRLNVVNWSTATACVANEADNKIYVTTTSGSTHKFWVVDLNDPSSPDQYTNSWGETAAMVLFDTAEPDFTVSSSTIESVLTSKLSVSSSIVNLNISNYFLPHRLAQERLNTLAASDHTEWIATEATDYFDVFIRQIAWQMGFAYGVGKACGYWHPRYAYGYLQGTYDGSPKTLNWFVVTDWDGTSPSTTSRTQHLYFFDPHDGTIEDYSTTNWTFDKIWG